MAHSSQITARIARFRPERLLRVALVALMAFRVASAGAQTGNILSEDFENFNPGGPGSYWTAGGTGNSTSILGWFGAADPASLAPGVHPYASNPLITSYNGAHYSYAEAVFSGSEPASMLLVSPLLTLHDNDTVSLQLQGWGDMGSGIEQYFEVYFRPDGPFAVYPDNGGIQLYSGPAPTSDMMPQAAFSSYSKISIPVAPWLGLGSGTGGRLVFRYYVPNGQAGPGTARIQMDELRVTRGCPTVTPTGNQVLCGGNMLNLSFSSGPFYNWTSTNPDLLPAVGYGTISALMPNVASAQSGYITVRPVFPGCTYRPFTLRLQVNPTPVITGVVNGSQQVCDGSATQPVTFTSNQAGTSYSWTSNAGNFSNVSTSGSGEAIPSFTPHVTANAVQQVTFTVRGSLNGCASSNTVMPTLTISPVARSLSYAGSPFCAEGRATPTLNASRFGTFSGTAGLSIDASGALSINATPAGTYTAQYAVNAAAWCPAAATAGIKVLARASVSSAPNQYYCNGVTTAPITFTGNGGSYAWTSDNTSIGMAASGMGSIPAFTTVNPGPGTRIAIIHVTSPGDGVNTCASKAAVFQYTISYCPGAGHRASAASVDVSPNPAREAVMVELHSLGSGTATVQVVDGFGNPVMAPVVTSAATLRLNLSALRPGHYLIQAINPRSGERAQQQFVKL